MKIKISFLRSKLHDNKYLDETNSKFISDIEKCLNIKLETAEVDDYKCDLKLIFIESGGSEGLFLSQINNLKEPYYLLTSGCNNSLAASMEILTYLNLNNKHGEILHGSVEYIAKRIKELVLINYVKSNLKKKRLGLLGKPSDWLIASIPSRYVLKNTLGIDLVDVKIEEIIDEFHKTKIEEYHETRELEFDKKSLDDAKRMYVAIDKLREKYKLDGLTIRCFDLLSTCKTTSCLGLALLNDKHIVSTCEGDVMSMIGMTILEMLLKQETFQANPSRIDLEKNEITFAHCTIPFNMLEEYHLDTHFESGIGVGIKGELKCQDITVFRMSSDMKHYFVAEGKIIKNLSESNLCRTQIQVKMDDPIDTLFTNPCGNHHIIVYGHHKDLIEKLMKSYNFITY